MESGVLDKGDIQKVQGRGASRTGLGSTGLGMRMCIVILYSDMWPCMQNTALLVVFVDLYKLELFTIT